MVVYFFRLWIKKVHGFENIPKNKPAILVSNHLSYLDFLTLAAILRKNTVFTAIKDLDKRKFVGWFTKLDIIIYVDRDKPGYKFFKEMIRHLRLHKRLLVMYPEATRSRSGKMLAPKPGFVKLALKANVPIIPIAMKYTYEILPPHKNFPKLKRCEISIDKPIEITRENPELVHIFQPNEHAINQKHIECIAFHVMEKIRKMSGQAWDESVAVPELLKSENRRIF
jgi:1-acyl-sn-glycerol-3-phosphate acyltransferase